MQRVCLLGERQDMGKQYVESTHTKLKKRPNLQKVKAALHVYKRALGQFAHL